MAANFEKIAEQFVAYYYEKFDTDRSLLSALYRDNSMLTFESAAVMGTANIVQKLVELPFRKVEHVVATRDAQPSINGGILVLVTGQLLAEGQERPFNFSQAFQLMPDGESYFVYNDIFKLVYG
ncbi:hypothetical protein DL768_004092 [Monosporascus sp. mg162]|nr:hypothetical protein DL768_004092 [Monosporascus sp. mg162]